MENTQFEQKYNSNKMFTVLIVEDEQNIIAMTTLLLQRAGYRVLIATNGGDGVEVARQQRPDLVLMDVHMPGMNGFEACRQIKEDPTVAFVSVILISGGRIDAESKSRGMLDAHADGFLIRPIPNGELLAHIETFLSG